MRKKYASYLYSTLDYSACSPCVMFDTSQVPFIVKTKGHDNVKCQTTVIKDGSIIQMHVVTINSTKTAIFCSWRTESLSSMQWHS